MAAMDQDIRFCTSADGVKLAYAVSGDGPPLVMSATWLTHLEHQWRSLAWRPWLDAFSLGRKLLRYDARGCGLSDHDTDDLSFDNWVSDFESVIDAGGFGRFDLLATCWAGRSRSPTLRGTPSELIASSSTAPMRSGDCAGTIGLKEIEKARVLLDLTRLGWGNENHAFQEVWV